MSRSPGKMVRFERDSQHEQGEHCLNCGTELSGPYCFYCGQPDKRLMVFLPALLREIAEDFFDFDSRFFRTLKPLLLKPGELTASYIAGRRARYSPPWRLYLISSLLFFLLMAVSASFGVSMDDPSEFQEGFAEGAGLSDSSGSAADDVSASGESDPPENLSLEQRAANDALIAINQVYVDHDQTEPLTGDRAERLNDEIVRQIQRAHAWKENDFTLKLFSDDPWDRETNPLIIPLAPDRFNDWLNDEIARSPEKAEQITDDPGLIIEQILDVLPVAIFLLLPVFALLLKIFYLFAGRYYIEHLIFALHNHAFIFVAGIVIWGLDFISDIIGWGWLDALVQILALIFMIWLPVYFWVAMYRVYRQNWFLTTLKYLLVGFTYLNILLFSIIGAMLVAFLKV